MSLLSIRGWIGLLIAGVFALAACSPPMQSGTVTDKSYTPAYTVNDQCYSYNSDGTCRTYGPRFIPASYYIEIDGVDREGELRSVWISVYSGTYDSCDVGDSWTKETGCY